MPTEEEKAYIAGFIDGEGCLNIHSWKKNNRTLRHLRVMVVNTDPTVLEFIKGIYGGSLSSSDYIPKNKIRWILTITSRKALVLLEDIRPYLRIKQKQADVCIFFQKERTYTKKKTDRVWDKTLTEIMHGLNKRGK